MKVLAPGILLVAVAALAASSMLGRSVHRVPTPLSVTGAVAVAVDATVTHQTIEGFGATNVPLVYAGQDVLSTTLRSRALDAVYGQVGITTGNLEANLLESPGSYDARQNDNGDPNVINWAGFQGSAIDDINSKVLGWAEAGRFTDYVISQKINTRWASPWLASLRDNDYQRYLDEAAEQVSASCAYWRDNYGGITPLLQLFNEPLSGNTELAGGQTQDLVDLIIRVGDRLRRDGFDRVRFLVPNEETEEKTYDSAQAILSNPRARAYVGAIGYHPYPYGSVYANIPRVLATSGAGQPDPGRIQARQRLRDLAAQYGVPLWMTEVSNGGVDARSYDDFRGRAIHIHDELVYADASAYFGMNNMWDTASQRMHFGSTDNFFMQEGNIVLLDDATDTVYVTGIGYAIGHYARWIGKGTIRIEATSSDPLLEVSAFRDDRQGRFVFVLINNSASSRPVSIALAGGALQGPITGEQSTPAAYWAPLPPQFSWDDRSLRLTVPGLSVTTLAAAVATAPQTPAVVHRKR